MAIITQFVKEMFQGSLVNKLMKNEVRINRNSRLIIVASNTNISKKWFKKLCEWDIVDSMTSAKLVTDVVNLRGYLDENITVLVDIDSFGYTNQWDKWIQIKQKLESTRTKYMMLNEFDTKYTFLKNFNNIQAL
jgi:hypothetical protein